MGYSADARHVRVDFFKPGGKWYITESVEWKPAKSGRVTQEFHQVLERHLTAESGRYKRIRLGGCTAVCLEPYHKSAHPVMAVVPGDGNWMEKDR